MGQLYSNSRKMGMKGLKVNSGVLVGQLYSNSRKMGMKDLKVNSDRLLSGSVV